MEIKFSILSIENYFICSVRWLRFEELY